MAKLLKVAIVAASLLALVKLAAKRGRQLDRKTAQDALMTWDDEGGSVRKGR